MTGPNDDVQRQAAENDDNDDDNTAVEAKARDQGWVPLDEFGGDPDAWNDAGEYLKRADPRHLRKQLSQTERQLRDIQKQQNELKLAFDQRLQRMERLSQTQRRKLYNDIEIARRAAVEVGDTQEYDRLNAAEQRLYELEQPAEPQAGNGQARKAADEPHPEVERWVQVNPWFLKDRVLNRAAVGMHEALLEDEPGLTVSQNLARVKQELMRRFPEKFARRTEGGRESNVEGGEGGQRAASSTPRGKGWNDIPSEERTIIARHIAEGLYKDKTDAAAAYWNLS